MADLGGLVPAWHWQNRVEKPRYEKQIDELKKGLKSADPEKLKEATVKELAASECLASPPGWVMQRSR